MAVQPFVPVPRPNPNRTAAQAATPQPEAGTDLKNEWKTFLGQPENRMALLSFGLSMLNPPTRNNLGANVGNALQTGLQTRDTVIKGQTGAAADTADLQSKIELRSAQAARARRPPGKGSQPSATAGQFTQKDLMKEYVKFVKEARALDEDKPIADIKAEFDEMLAAAAPAAAAPVASGPDPIMAAVLQESGKGSFDEMTPEELAAASARYKALQKAK